MLEFINQEANITTTENGAATYASTNSYCLDLFATIGALRNSYEDEIVSRFIRAYAENADLAMKILFFARDIRGGLGERRVFRVILSWLAENEPYSVRQNLAYIAEYGRYDDYLVLMDTACEREMLDLLKAQFDNDLANLDKHGEVSLLTKWLPSVNTSSKDTVYLAKRVARAFGMNDASYRKALSALRAQIHIIENNLRTRDYTFDYEKQPSRAMFKYKQAFIRNDQERYMTFLNNVLQGKATLHADNVAPYELIRPYVMCNSAFELINPIVEEEKVTLNTLWTALPDFCGDEDMLAVIDTSGSMYWRGGLPAAVALSLGLYLAEHNKGRFRNHFVTFSDHPHFVRLKGKTFADKLQYALTFCEGWGTDLEAVFELILRAAVMNKLPQKELPGKLVIISDMEFNVCVTNASETNFENARRRYEAYGYKLPEIVFWNVGSRNRQQPVTMNEQGVALVSGVTPRLFSMIAGNELSPYKLMMETLGSERYASIVA